MRSGKCSPLGMVALVCLVSLIVPAVCGCRSHPARLGPIRVLRIEGVEKCMNYSRVSFVWVSGTIKDRPAGLLAREGDILWVETGKEALYLVPYAESDGRSLSFEEKESRLLLGGRPVAIDLGGDTAGWQWLKTAAHKDLTSVRFVYLPDGTDTSERALLKKLAEASPHAGLAAKGDTLREALSLFRPASLVVDSVSLKEPGLAPLSSLRELTFLAINVDKDDTPDLQVLARLPRLRQLVLIGLERMVDLSPAAECERLQSVCIVMYKAEELASVARLTGIKELHLIMAQDLADLSALSALTELQTLTLTLSGGEEPIDLAVLRKLKGLKWLGFPPGVTHEQFAAAVKDHPRLEAVELVACENVEDLSPLRDLPDLKALVLVDSKATTGPPLNELKGLRLLVLHKDGVEKEPEKIRELEKDLPECLIVGGEGMCLGSGWIVLLIPFAAVGWLVSRRRRPRHLH